MKNSKALIAASGFALVAAFLAGQAGAEQVKLSTPDGAIEMSGDLIGFNGTDYTVLSAVGVVTVSAASVICEGDACPQPEAGVSAFSVANLRPEAELIKISD